ncbi:unnamed protein product [Amoebophrya sp. A25]|nr:unnamed protein product [Amoebophrya sp. A25]|eukprot:GSA25T00008340001.1
MSIPSIPGGHSGPKTPKLCVHLADVEDLDEDPTSFAVAMDGSLGARACLDLAYKFFFQKKAASTVEVIHIYDPTVQDGLMRGYKKDVIESDVRALDISHGKRFTLTVVPKNGSEVEGKTLCKWTYDKEEQGHCIDFMLMGFKGSKNASEEALLASDVSYCLAYSRCSMIVLRDWTMPESGLLHYLVPVDLSQWSEKALYDALLLSNPGDKITVLRVSFESQETEGRHKEYYQKLIDRISKKFGKPRDIQLQVVTSAGKGVSNCILDYADDSNVDFICMGTDVKRLQSQKSYLGSVSGSVLLSGRYPMVIARYDAEFESVVSSNSKPFIEGLPQSLDIKIFGNK